MSIRATMGIPDDVDGYITREYYSVEESGTRIVLLLVRDGGVDSGKRITFWKNDAKDRLLYDDLRSEGINPH